MKRILLITLLVLLINHLHSQTLPNAYFENPQELNCEWDETGTSTVHGFPEWRGYQTIDNSWDGQIDSTACFDIATPGINWAVLYSQEVEANRPVFIRSMMDTANYVQLDSNSLYGVRVEKYSVNYLNLFDTCSNGMCSGAITEVEIPNSTGSGSVIRSTISPFGNWDYDFCLVTEKFPDHNLLKTFVIKLLAANPTANDSIRLFGVTIENMEFSTLKMTQIDAYDFDGSEYYWENWDYLRPNSLMLHHSPGYPDAQNMSYIDVAPFPNTATQENVNIMVYFMQSINFQPYTTLRGGLVEGDTLRHNFNLINEGGSICMAPFIELIMEKGDHYTHQSGELSFGNNNACMRFKEGSSLVVAPNASLHYGKRRMGMLALCSGSTLELKENAELVIGNTLVLKEEPTTQEKNEIVVDLQTGNTLRFSPGSSIKVHSNTPHDFKLIVKMNGGTLDDSGLSAEDKLKIERIWPSTLPPTEDGFRILGNPIVDQLVFDFQSEQSQTLSLTLTNLNGKQCLQSYVEVESGLNSGQVPLPSLDPGFYFLTVRSYHGRFTRKVILR